MKLNLDSSMKWYFIPGQETMAREVNKNKIMLFLK